MVYFHGQTPPVPIVFKADDTQLPKRWLAGERLGWLVLGGHGLNYDPALNLKATGNHTSGTTTGGLSDFLQIMSEQVEMADTATRAVDVMDVVVSAPLAAYVLPAYSDSFLVALDQAATAARAGDPCESIRVLGTRLRRVDGQPTPPDWVQDSTVTEHLRTRINGLILEYWAATGGTCAITTDVPAEPRAGNAIAIQFVRPNPSKGNSTIGFSLTRRGKVSLAIYDLGGRVVKMLAEGEMEAGDHTVTWTANNASGGLVPSGIYFAKLISAGVADVKRVMIIR